MDEVKADKKEESKEENKVEKVEKEKKLDVDPRTNKVGKYLFKSVKTIDIL